jgi:hypothetical protein
LAIIDVIIGYAVNQFKVWWRKVVSKKFPNAADILEALLEYTVEVCQFTAKVVKFLSPYIVWLIQTFIAIVLFIGGSFICGIIILSKGRDAAENSHAGEVQSSAMKSLNLSIQNSPFYSRKAVPFTPKFLRDERVDAPIVVNQTVAAANTSGSNGGGRRVQSTASFKSPPVGGQMAPISAMRRSSSLKSNQNTPTVVATKPTPNTRRVLFSESEHGEVDTEQFFYDKTLPASVRKVGRVNNENRQQQQQQMMMIMADATQNDTPNKTTSPKMASTITVAENTILRPSSFGPGASSTDNRSQHKNSTSQVAAAVTNQPSTAVKKQQAEQEEQSKQQYIEKYGLLPTITPLSKRYGRMKRQQQQNQSLVTALSTIPANKTTGTNNVNAKRKRREIVGAASRMGRRRLNNFRANGSALPVVMLGKNTPTKRRREDEQTRADEWVWRAMNSDSEKENLNSQGDGTATKRAKVVNDGSGPQEGIPPGLSTPPKSVNKSFSSVTTPPKTPGPSTFSLGSSTPAPKGNKDSSIGTTPAKPSMSSFTFNDTSSSSGGGFSFGTSSGDAATDAKSNNKEANVKTKDNAPAFSFGSTGASKLAEKNETIAPSFSFGVGGDAANSDDTNASASAKPDEQKDAAPSFSFGAAGSKTTSKDVKETEQRQSFAFGASSSTPAPTAQDSSTKAPFSFGSKTNTPAASDAPSEIKQAPSFAFGSTSTPAQDSTTKPSFSFGSTGQANVPSTSQAPAAAAKTPAPAATGFAFGAANQTPAAATGTQSSGFSFGAANQTPAASTAATAGETKQAPSFSFGGTAAAPAPNQTPATAPSVPAPSFSFGSTTATAPTTGATPASTFAFGGQTPGAGGGVTNSFTVGGSGASARRRAKAAGRRK